MVVTGVPRLASPRARTRTVALAIALTHLSVASFEAAMARSKR